MSFSTMLRGMGLGRISDQTKMKLAKTIIQTESGGGLVKVAISGALRVESISIDPSLKNVDVIEDLVKSAVNDGIKKAEEIVAEEIDKTVDNVAGEFMNNFFNQNKKF